MKHLSKTNNQAKNRKDQRGQSLVEVALFFPIFIILLAGLVEVSQLLVTQNRVSSAARAATRFASNGGQDEGVAPTVLNTITQTLAIDESVWDIWVIRATVDNTGAGFDSNNGGAWSFTHVYGISNTVRSSSISETAIRDRVIDELQRDELNNQVSGIANGLQIVGTYAIHDVDSILGLDAMSQLAGFSSLNALSVMRIIANTQNVTNGCAAFPIAVYDGIRSVTDPAQAGQVNPYPTSGFSYPSNPPIYDSFVNHRDDRPLTIAEEGDVFMLRAPQNNSTPGNFGWIVWNTDVSNNANILEHSLDWPGDSTDYSPCTGPGCGSAPFRGYSEPNFNPGESGDPTDRSLHIGDAVATSQGNMNSSGIRGVLEDHIRLDRTLRVIVWNESNGQGGSNGRYRISGFAIFRLVGYSTSGNWILAEFIRWDTSCGQLN